MRRQLQLGSQLLQSSRCRNVGAAAPRFETRLGRNFTGIEPLNLNPNPKSLNPTPLNLKPQVIASTVVESVQCAKSRQLYEQAAARMSHHSLETEVATYAGKVSISGAEEPDRKVFKALSEAFNTRVFCKEHSAFSSHSDYGRIFQPISSIERKEPPANGNVEHVNKI